MAERNLAIWSLFLLSCIFCTETTSQTPQIHSIRSRNHNDRARNNNNNNIIVACQVTRYQNLCVRSLSEFPSAANQSPQQLAQLALAVSLYRARSTRAYLMGVGKKLEAQKAQDYPIIRDCLDQLGDGISQLSQSITGLRQISHDQATISSNDFSFHASNVETWASAAYTDASFCLNSFPTHRRMNKMKATVRGKVMNVAQVTSNALALVHHYAANYRPVKP